MERAHTDIVPGTYASDAGAPRRPRRQPSPERAEHLEAESSEGSSDVAEVPAPARGGGMGERSQTHAEGVHDVKPAVTKSNYSLDISAEDDRPHGGGYYGRSAMNAAEARIFKMSLEEWAAADREATGAWRCSTRRAVSHADLQPLPTDVPALQGKFFVHDGAVTDLATDGIVNAANEGCMGGGGVDGAIHSAAGPLLVRECATFNGCKTGHTRITKAYNLPARYVLHTVGPVGERPRELTSCYSTCFTLMRRFNLRSVGFCCVSTGIFGYPLKNASAIALQVAVAEVLKCPEAYDAIVFACFRREEGDVYRRLWPQVLERVANTSADK